MIEPTLGDIMGVILRGEGIGLAPPPPFQATELEGRQCSAWALAALVAEQSPVSMADALDAIFHVPDNMLCLLDSPQGWTALASFISLDLGSPDLLLIPTLH